MVKVPDNEDDLTKKQEEILRKALEDPDKSAKEIATETDSSTSYVREVRRDLEDKATLEKTEKSGGNGGLFLLLFFIVAGVYWAFQAGVI